MHTESVPRLHAQITNQSTTPYTTKICCGKVGCMIKSFKSW